ncbi:inositol monophosphatase, partial [Candidatus Bathyarchaeota archaeon]|nr:inositol monophosphatase [Candidatus Bathyarchaeota archaeon]
KGTLRNEEKMNPSSTTSLENAVIGMDFNTFKIKELLTRLTPLLQKTKHLRHLGANALEICYVADGTIDAFIDLRGKLRVTDIAAAYLILREAGGIMVTPEGTEINVPLDPAQRVSFIATANKQLYENIKTRLALTKH